MTENFDNDFAYIFGGSVRANIEIHSLLEGKLEFIALDPAPEWITHDCAIVVKIKRYNLKYAKKLIAKLKPGHDEIRFF